MILKHLSYSWSSWLTVAAGLLASTFAMTLSMLGLAVIVGQESLQPGVLSEEQRQWLFSITGFNLGMCLMVMMFVASTSIRVLIAQQRPLLGQFALLGATPGQLFRLVVAQLSIVTALFGGMGAALASLAVRPVITWVWDMMERTETTSNTTQLVLTVTVWWWILGTIGVVASVLAVVLGAARRTWILVHLWPKQTALTSRQSGRALRREGHPIRAAWQVMCSAIARPMLALGAFGMVIGAIVNVRSMADNADQRALNMNDVGEQLASSILLLYLGAVLLLGVAGPWLAYLLTLLLQKMVPSRCASVWLSVRALQSRIDIVGSVTAVAGVTVLLPAGLASTSATLGTALPVSNPAEAYVALFTLPCTIALIGSLSGVIALRGERSRERLQLSVLGATGGQNRAALLMEALLMVLIAAVLVFADDWMITLYTGWAVQEIFQVGSVHFAWMFFAICMSIASLLLMGAVLVPGRRSRSSGGLCGAGTSFASLV